MNIKSLKATRAGRAMTRLFGEEKGAVLMEYVVLGVLLVAAVVAAVIVFGNRERDAFDVMGKSISGDTAGAQQKQEEGKGRQESGATAAEAQGQGVNGGEY